MLYGRRVIEPQRVPHGQGPRRFILNKSFQYKYCWYMVTAVAGGAVLFLLPAYYFIVQNYDLFKSLAYDTHPYLVEHLEREVTWLKIFLSASFLFLMGVTLFLGIRMTKNLLSPLVTMERHMHQLMLGQWHIPDYHLPEEDDYRDLAMTYDYFYRALKANTETELKLLEKLSIDPQNREAYAAWKHLLAEKRARLGIREEFITNDSVVDLSEFDQRRRVS
ncbi:hypothetical protein AZI87_09810 [Bdellovibrio bacteriovorus]|uniref:HAMP domain-containing protein n=1 Tax=Bdellovibrio bacteriovorus TaxID=959 RepID=A0A162H1X8_BDEBC|nr:hypothetical protein [Bdellovibrio bacteriovorus]KYG69466.1 hypothetical protein AZI87_09810 [Bdellovibrio bacteriovorus]